MHSRLKKIGFGVALVLSILFLVVSILTWDLFLGACAFVMGIGLMRFFEMENEKI